MGPIGLMGGSIALATGDTAGLGRDATAGKFQWFTTWMMRHPVTEGDACTTPVCPFVVMLHDGIVTVAHVCRAKIGRYFVVAKLDSVLLVTEPRIRVQFADRFIGVRLALFRIQ